MIRFVGLCMLWLSLCCSPLVKTPLLTKFRIKWRQFPLVVSIEPNLCPFAVPAVNDWNEKMGRKILLPVCQYIEGAEIYVGQGGDKCKKLGLPEQAAAVALPLGTKSIILTCRKIQLSAHNMPMWVGIFRHELGHSLGLAHVNQKGSLMYPSSDEAELKIKSPDVRAVEEVIDGRF